MIQSGTTTLKLEYSFSSQELIGIDKDYNIKKWDFRPFRFQIGILPVLITPQISIDAEVKGDIKGSINYQYEGIVSDEYQLLYNDGTFSDSKKSN